jgi:diguanylate cyclase (GGDEF)-like protein
MIFRIKTPFITLLIFFCCSFFVAQVVAEQEITKKTLNKQILNTTISAKKTPYFELNELNTQQINEKLIWRSIESHQTPLNFAAIKQLLPLSKNIEKSIIGTSGAYLAKIPLRNTKYLTTTWYLNPNTNFVDKGIAFWEQSDGSILKLADFSQFNDKSIPILMHSQAFSLTTQPYEQGVLWLYIEAKQYTYPLNLKIFSESAFYRHQFINNIITYIAIAVMLTLALFASIIFIRTKHKITITCAAYIGLMGFGWAAAAGLLDDIFSITWFNTTYAGFLLFPLAKAFACQFTKLLFNCDHDFPKLAILLNTLTKVCLVLTLFMPVISFTAAYLIAHIVAIIWLPLSVTIGFIMLKQNDFRAKYYFTGNLLYMLTLSYYMLTHVELMDSVVYPELLVLSALAIDCVCISLSLSEWLYLKQRDYNRNYYLARLDPLTGVGNRYALNEKLERIKHHFVIVFIDFDGLKMINDNLGHQEGDALLASGAELMRDKVNNMGIVFRTGGDEFVWLFEHKQVNRSSVLINKIPLLIAHCETELQKIWVDAGISFGIASSTEGHSQSECLTLADERMYQNKKTKRHANKVPIT